MGSHSDKRIIGFDAREGQEWVRIDQAIPQACEGDHVPILVATFDACYDEINPGRGYDIEWSYWGIEHFSQELEFLSHTPGMLEETDLTPHMDPPTHWRYLAKKPQNLGISSDGWVAVEDRLPEIPEGQYSVSVIIADIHTENGAHPFSGLGHASFKPAARGSEDVDFFVWNADGVPERVGTVTHWQLMPLAPAYDPEALNPIFRWYHEHALPQSPLKQLPTTQEEAADDSTRRKDV